MKKLTVEKINGAIVKSQTSGVLNSARNLMIKSMVSGTAAGMAMDVTSKTIDGVAYAITGEGLTGKGKVAGLVVSAAAGVYVGVKAGQMSDYLIHQYEDSLAQRDAGEGIQDTEEEEEEAGDIGTPGSVNQTDFKETDEQPASEAPKKEPKTK